MKIQFYIAIVSLFFSVVFWNMFINNITDNTVYLQNDLIIYNFKQIGLFAASAFSSFCLFVSLGGLIYGEE